MRMRSDLRPMSDLVYYLPYARRLLVVEPEYRQGLDRPEGERNQKWQRDDVHIISFDSLSLLTLFQTLRLNRPRLKG